MALGNGNSYRSKFYVQTDPKWTLGAFKLHTNYSLGKKAIGKYFQRLALNTILFTKPLLKDFWKGVVPQLEK